jgi:hypothetical protein
MARKKATLGEGNCECGTLPPSPMVRGAALEFSVRVSNHGYLSLVIGNTRGFSSDARRCVVRTH